MNTGIYFYNPTYSSEECKNLNDSFIPATGIDCWINQSYLNLRNILKDRIHLVNEIPESGIIVFHPKYFPKDFIPSINQFLICAQADYGRHRFAQINLVQNQDQLNSFYYNKRAKTDRLFKFSDNLYLPHWQHPHLIKRSVERKNLVEQVAFFGNPKNIDPLILGKVPDELYHRGMRFSLKMNKKDFYDYSEVDIALAVRSFFDNSYINKPYWKILNAVLCGSLILASSESSSIHFKKYFYPELPIISSYTDLIRILESIKMNPDSYFTPLRLAQDRLMSYYHPSLINNWLNVFEIATKKFQSWRTSNQIYREAFIKYRSI